MSTLLMDFLLSACMSFCDKTKRSDSLTIEPICNTTPIKLKCVSPYDARSTPAVTMQSRPTVPRLKRSTPSAQLVQYTTRTVRAFII
jgi:hypothetical protein